MLTEGDAVLKNKKGVAKGGRGKKDKRKKGATRQGLIRALHEAGIKVDHTRKGHFV